MTLAEKMLRLKEIISDCGGAVIGYSGGVDSTFLAFVANEVLQDKALAVTACSATYPDHEIKAAQDLAQSLNLRHLTIWTDELINDLFAANPPDRCYHCKTELFSKLTEIAQENGLATVFDGANLDDLNDFRPGAKAGKEFGVRSPLKEAGLTKEDIRTLSQEHGLPTWNKPSFACLSSRFPYGERITEDKLLMVGKAEDYLRSLGFGQLRVRLHGSIARIEVEPNELSNVVSSADRIIAKMKQLGYSYITLDLQGFRTGSMNEVLSVQQMNLDL
jgi:uncharacterized protein